MRRIFRGLNRKSKPVRSGEPGRRVERRRDVVCLIEIRSLWLARLQPPALPSRRVPRDQVVLDGILEHRREPPARADCGSSPPLGGTAKIRPKCAIAALRTGKRTHDRRLLRMPFSEGNSVICCGECESRHCGSSPDSLQRTGLRLAPTAACSESPGTSLDEHNVPFCGLRRALIVAGARPIAGFGRILAVPLNDFQNTFLRIEGLSTPISCR